MADGTKIEWTEATWNPITGCSVLSPGCTNCYAMQLAGTRLEHHPSRAGLTRLSGGRPKWTGEVRFNEAWLADPLKWKRPRMIFVCAHGDLFHESVPDEWIDRVFAVMALCPQHTFQVLTKRSDRMRQYFSKVRDEGGLCDSMAIIWERALDVATEIGLLEHYQPRLCVLPNVWLGVSVEDQQRADERIPDLLATPAAVRWLSCEPLLGPVDLRHVRRYTGKPIIDALRGLVTYADYHARTPDECSFNTRTQCIPPELPKLDWIVAGGESGRGARPMQPDWARQLRGQCASAGVPFFFKQWGGHRPTSDCQHGEYMIPATKKEAGRLLDGRLHDAMPERGA